VENKLKRATAFVSGLGYNEFYINGEKVGDRVLEPAQTNYDIFAFYSTFDITGYLRQGMNCAGIMLGDGWYNQNKAFGIDLSYGKPVAICQIELEFEDGKTETIISDSDWLWAAGPVVTANVYAGETYDARKEIKNWCNQETPEGEWEKAKMATVYPPELKSQLMPPIKRMNELDVQQIFDIGNGKYTIDFGQNFAGWVKIKVKKKEGTKITIRMSEEIYPDHTLDFTSTGVNATRFIQTDSYICKGSETEIWEPRFTYHGFRYAEVSGLTEKPGKETLKGIVVYTSVEPAGTFQCSDEQINRIHEMAKWTLISNLHGFPSDCPHREKCGWLGDAHAIAPMSVYNFDMENFWIKYLYDIRSSAVRSGQALFHKVKNRDFYFGYKKPGLPFMIAPGKRDCGVASPDWGTALVQIPWYLYLYYGNEDIVKEFYPDMKLWVEYVDSLTINNIVPFGLGDWCPPGGIDSIDCPYQLSSTAFFYNDLVLMEKMAGIIQNKSDARQFSERIELVKRAFISEFYNEKGKTFGSQTANSLALDFGLVPVGDEKAVSHAIAKDVNEKYKGFHHAGIFGLPKIFDALAKHENQETAFQILAGKGRKSFENMWKYYNATTLWEELPVDIPANDEYQNDKFGSHSHPMQGGFDAWFYKGIAGIAPITEAPGFMQIRFEPLLVNQLQWAKATHNSKYGEIMSNWRWYNKKLVWEIKIPAGCTGHVVIPFKNPASLYVNREKKDLKSTLNTEGCFTLPSGKYILEINP
jgi:alpha-L-rhamnosidase